MDSYNLFEHDGSSLVGGSAPINPADSFVERPNASVNPTPKDNVSQNFQSGYAEHGTMPHKSMMPAAPGQYYNSYAPRPSLHYNPPESLYSLNPQTGGGGGGSAWPRSRPAYPTAPPVPHNYPYANEQKLNPYPQKALSMGMHAMPGSNAHNMQSHYSHIPPQDLYNQGYAGYADVLPQPAVPSGQTNYRQTANTNPYPYYHHQYHPHQMSSQGIPSQPRQETIPQRSNDPNLHYRPEPHQPPMNATPLKPTPPTNQKFENTIQMQNISMNSSDQIQGQLPRIPYQYSSYPQPQNQRTIDINSYDSQYVGQKNINPYALPVKPMTPSQISPQSISKQEHISPLYNYQQQNTTPHFAEHIGKPLKSDALNVNTNPVTGNTGTYNASLNVPQSLSKFEHSDLFKGNIQSDKLDSFENKTAPISRNEMEEKPSLSVSRSSATNNFGHLSLEKENFIRNEIFKQSDEKINDVEKSIDKITNGSTNSVDQLQTSQSQIKQTLVSADMSISQPVFLNEDSFSKEIKHTSSSIHEVVETTSDLNDNEKNKIKPGSNVLSPSLASNEMANTMAHTSTLLSNYLIGPSDLETGQIQPLTPAGPAIDHKPVVEINPETPVAAIISASNLLNSNISQDPYAFNDDTAVQLMGVNTGNVISNTADTENASTSPKKEHKAKKPRKPREPKPKVDTETNSPKKERKRRAPSDPGAPKRRYTKKAINKPEISTSTENPPETEVSAPVAELQEENIISNSEQTSLENQDNITDFDDIPVSKIAIKDLIEESKSKSKAEEEVSPQPKRARTGSRRSIIGLNTKRSKGRTRKRNNYTLESDGEGDDLMSTPPPSPCKSECDSSKRRSTRNTQRKKYTDDVLLRFSDDENAIKSKRLKSFDIGLESEDQLSSEGFINVTGEGSNIVQHILACRMSKREVVVNIAEENKVKEEVEENENSVQSTSIEENEDSQLVENTKIETAIPESIKKTDITVKNDTETCESEENEIPESLESLAKKIDVNLADAGNFKKDLIETKPNIDENDKAKPNTEKTIEKTAIIEVEEYFVKYRPLSYLHCEWKTESELYEDDRRIASKIKRFKIKQAQQLNIFELLDEEPFNPDYIEVDRILDVSETHNEDTDKAEKRYLVKWKSLQYDESTWEKEEDVDVDKIKIFEKFSCLPSKDKWKFKRRPNPDQWQQLKDSPIYKGGNSLRNYQLEGLNWLLFSYFNCRNCILADEMGLGKTIQSLTFVNSVFEYGIRGPFLIIAPLSTIPNWQREFETWTDLNVIVYHGSQQSKNWLKNYEFFYKNENGLPIKDITKFNVLITTFEMIVTDIHDLSCFNWRICVIDEAHRLKNRNCKLLEGLRQLSLEHRVLLSGTPLQNNVNELFSLLNFLEPSQFSNNDAFLQEFGQLKSESEVLKLQAILKPMMLRRLKEDVEKSLGPKEETIIEVELTNIQKKYYRGILERNFSFLVKGTSAAANIPNLMNTMMELRKCCIHPYLLNGAEDQITYDYKQAHGEDIEAYYKALIQSSGKMVLIDKLLPKLKAGGHRVLIFSQMVRCLDILEDYLIFRKYPFERIDGRIRGNLRQEAIDRFSKPDSDRFVFLLCTKAGGLGINLTAADTVIIYDSDWNPQNDLQAQARCHRIGQQKMVKIYRLICQNTYEREMFDKASLKLGLDKAVLQSMNTAAGKEAGSKQLSKAEIEDLLKKGAYGAVMDEDNAGDKFCEEDIEMILARRTQVIQMESEKGSTFSKASFSSNNLRCDIDVNDPDFWNKWAKKAEVDTTEKKEVEDLIVTEPRRRTMIKRYGQDEEAVEMSEEELSVDSDEDLEGLSLRSKKLKEKYKKKSKKYSSDDYIPRHESVPNEDVVYGSWARSECFKIERGLLTFGWGRWNEIIDKNQFRKGWTLSVVEDCARIIVLYCLRNYKGDEKILNFIWDLIEPCENGEVTISRNHSGLHNPVPRGRNARKKMKTKELPKSNSPQKWENCDHWSSDEKFDCENHLERSFKKHLLRHANKVLLRIRMMYYIKQEIIGEYTQDLDNGIHASHLGIRVPRSVDGPVPRSWWDQACDVSLLVGTYLHGYENYLAMRSDPQLQFIVKLGPPNDEECTVIRNDQKTGRLSDRDGDGDRDVDGESASEDEAIEGPSESTRWPTLQELNARLRRLISAYQRNYKKEEMKQQQFAKKAERKERMESFVREEMSQWKWTKADEESFRRTVASYGVEFDPSTKSLQWSRFRTLAGLDTKTDEHLTEYLKAFMAMCKKQCGLSVGEAELPSRDFRAEPISEERAIVTLERIDLLRVLREEIATNSSLDDKLKLCKASSDNPPWWQPGKHDKILVMGICKHGLEDSYNKLFCDPSLPFAECYQRWNEKNGRFSDHDSNQSSRRNTRRSGLSEREESDEGKVWFEEKSLESRLHHIAHVVQKNEWPEGISSSRSSDSGASNQGPIRAQISIDVETERAKLHALLSAPSRSENDQGTAPPPAHQQPRPAHTPPAAPQSSQAPLDLTAVGGLDRSKQVEPLKGKKRKKLDDIILGLSSKKIGNQSSNVISSTSTSINNTSISSTISPDVTVTKVTTSKQSFSEIPSLTVTRIPPDQYQSKASSSYDQTPKSDKKTKTILLDQLAKDSKWFTGDWYSQANLASLMRADLSSEDRRSSSQQYKKPDNKPQSSKSITSDYANNDLSSQLLKDLQRQASSSSAASISSASIEKQMKSVLNSFNSNLAYYSAASQNLANMNYPPAFDANFSSLSSLDNKQLAATLSSLAAFGTGLDTKLLNNYLKSLDGKYSNSSGSSQKHSHLSDKKRYPSSNLPGLEITKQESGSREKQSADRSQTPKASKTPTTPDYSHYSSFPLTNSLYASMGLGGLNPFGNQASLTSAYEAMLAQSGLLNGGLTKESLTSAKNKYKSSSTSSAKSLSSAYSGLEKSLLSSMSAHLDISKSQIPSSTSIESLKRSADPKTLEKRLRSEHQQNIPKAEASHSSSNTGEMDIEDLIAPTTVIRSGATQSPDKTSSVENCENQPLDLANNKTQSDKKHDNENKNGGEETHEENSRETSASRKSP